MPRLEQNISMMLLGLLGLLSTTASAAELLMFELEQCAPCQLFEKQIGRIYDRTEESRIAPLHRLAFGTPPPEYAYVRPPAVAPSFVLVDHGRELGRIEGYTSDELFWMNLSTQLRLIPGAAGQTP